MKATAHRKGRFVVAMPGVYLSEVCGCATIFTAKGAETRRLCGYATIFTAKGTETRR